MRSQLVFKSILVLVGLLSLSSANAAEKIIIGWLEQVHIGEARVRLNAKIDTGADNSSIKAVILKKFNRDGREWIRFRVKDKHGHSTVLERKLIRYARIKRKMAPSIKRPVVKLEICLGNIVREVEVNLAKRKRFKYHILIGRNFLHGLFLVDAEKKYTVKPACSGIKGD